MTRDYQRHTTDVDRRSMRIEVASRTERIWGWCVIWALIGAMGGYVVGRWILPAVLAR